MQGSVGDEAGVAQGPSVPAEPRSVALWSWGWLPSSTAQRLFLQRAPLTRWPLGNTDGVRSGDSRDPTDPAAHTRLRLLHADQPLGELSACFKIPGYDDVQKPGETGLVIAEGGEKILRIIIKILHARKTHRHHPKPRAVPVSGHPQTRALPFRCLQLPLTSPG